MKVSLANSIIALSVTLCLSACNNNSQEQTQYEDTPRIVKTQVLSKFDGYVQRHLTGKLQAADTTSLSFEVSGVVKKVYINLGESFKKGDLLAELDTELYMLTANQHSSLYSEARAARIEAKQSLERNLSLKQQSLVSQAVVDNSLAAFDIANERVNSALSAFQIANKNYSDTKLYAPYDGKVSQRLIEPSLQVTPQNLAFTIQGNANLEVNAVVPESLIGKIKLGEDVSLRIPALSDKQLYAGTLTEVGTQASVANAFPITITFNQSYSRLLPGMSAEILLPIREFSAPSVLQASANNKSIFDIPLSAVASDEQGQYVQVIDTHDNNYLVRKLYIEIAQTLPQSILARLSNENSNETDNEIEVVTAGVAFITNNQRVMPLNKIQQIYNQ